MVSTVTISPPEAASAGCAVSISRDAFSYEGNNSGGELYGPQHASVDGYRLVATIPTGARLVSYEIKMRITEEPYGGTRTTEEKTVTWNDPDIPVAMCDFWSDTDQDERDTWPWELSITKGDIGRRTPYPDGKYRPYGILIDSEYTYDPDGKGPPPLVGLVYQKVEVVSVTAHFNVPTPVGTGRILCSPSDNRILHGRAGTILFDG